MSFSDLLNNTCDIQERNESQDSLGEVDAGWQNKATDVSMRTQVGGTPSLLESLGETITIDRTFFFEKSVNISQEDRIVYNGKNWDVIRASEDSEGHHLEVATENVELA